MSTEIYWISEMRLSVRQLPKSTENIVNYNPPESIPTCGRHGPDHIISTMALPMGVLIEMAILQVVKI